MKSPLVTTADDAGRASEHFAWKIVAENVFGRVNNEWNFNFTLACVYFKMKSVDE